MNDWRLVFFACGALVLATSVVACDAQPNPDDVIEGTGDAGPSPSCVALKECCPSLPADVVASCKDLSVHADDAECGSLLMALQSRGSCEVGADAGTGVDGGALLDARAPGGDASADAGMAVGCTLLDTCCMSPALPADETDMCTSIEATNDESLCAGLLGSLAASQSCTGMAAGLGGACPTLQACCESESFPAVFSTDCLAEWNSGNNDECESHLSEYVGAGDCPGLTGPATAPECAQLAMCCDERSFPANDLTTCQQIAGGNQAANCLSAYDTYCGPP
jgi:hypothetical protein